MVIHQELMGMLDQEAVSYASSAGYFHEARFSLCIPPASL
jgi:hypothetical protein